jgi:hypothetical protein
VAQRKEINLLTPPDLSYLFSHSGIACHYPARASQGVIIIAPSPLSRQREGVFIMATVRPRQGVDKG